ncbi:C4-dicarboxylate transport sensor protein DctB [Ascidiaceihabitans donghaensis]|uniref:histidine kinase n=1 Tax=Ascidiaceihabitans donghaensis TaxID=1510460 RepID=A0A2R8BEB1_9RHOB|nr:ATP-binding protein [Ascidiaceihabitans donghaensis]SPH21399.1 C4-dicarboxylate transport sensor protein DctB [Ascidiaceihabitans donghaensis]
MRFTKLLSTFLVFLLAAGLYWASFSLFKSQEIEKAQARLTLYRSTLETELRHFAHLPFLLSLDPVVTRTLAGGPTKPLDYRLARFAQSAGLDAIYLMDDAGDTISASNAKGPNSFKGQNYAFRPYFQAAQQGELGEFYGIGVTTGIPGYFYAMPVRPPETDLDGVIAIKIDLSAVQETWQASGERIILANNDGVVLLASDPDWRYKTMAQLSTQQRTRILTSRQFGSEHLNPLDWSFDNTRQTATVGQERLLYLSTSDLPNSWTLHFFVPGDQAVTRAWLVTGGFLTLALLLFSLAQVNRLRRVRFALQKSEREETELRSANARLAIEIEDRRAAQRNLQRTQAELERAGRLAALGQLASSVTHELGQPIAAMKNQLVASEMTVGPSALSNKMQNLVDRMESITRQLKFFSRKGRDSFERFDLCAAMDAALELLEPSIKDRQAHIDFVRPDEATTLMANKLRIEQVMTNIVRNALDAVHDADVRRIEIAMGQTSRDVWFTVADTGHGLRGKTLDDLQEPFATTRESGAGMGLGLTITAGVVTDHGGTIQADDRSTGGTVFRVTLPKKEHSGD